jgi:hypothetical protein
LLKCFGGFLWLLSNILLSHVFVNTSTAHSNEVVVWFHLALSGGVRSNMYSIAWSTSFGNVGGRPDDIVFLCLFVCLWRYAHKRKMQAALDEIVHIKHVFKLRPGKAMGVLTIAQRRF